LYPALKHAGNHFVSWYCVKEKLTVNGYFKITPGYAGFCIFALILKICIMRSLLLFLVLLTFIACSPARKYRQLPDVLAWENNIRHLEQLDSSEIHPANAILFTGSSSIRLWSTLAHDMAPYPVIQRGYGGAKLSDFAVYAERIVIHPCRLLYFIIMTLPGTKDKVG
jgi:hypothetical protein